MKRLKQIAAVIGLWIFIPALVAVIWYYPIAVAIAIGGGAILLAMIYFSCEIWKELGK